MKNSTALEKLQKRVDELNDRYPSLNAKVQTSKFGGRLEVEVATVDKAKAANEMFQDITFVSGNYR